MSEAYNEFNEYDPPKDYQFEPELRLQSPRDLPDSVKQGKYYIRQRRLRLFLLLSGIICIVLSFVPLVQNWGHYLLVLSYLHWIGLGMLAIFAIHFMVRLFSPGAFRYIREGIPFVVKILGVAKMPTSYYNGQPVGHAFRAVVLFVHPETQQLETLKVSSEQINQVSKDSVDTTLKTGDYVTAVYLPGRFDKTLKLYGFLELTPESSVLRKPVKKESEKRKSTITSSILIAYFVLFFFLIIFGLIMIAKYSPVEFTFDHIMEHAVSIATCSILTCISMFGLLYLNERYEREKIEANNRQNAETGGVFEMAPKSMFRVKGIGGGAFMILILAGGLLLGGVFMIEGYYAYNAIGDSSAPKYVPVEIQSMGTVTYSFLFRTYQISYNFTDSNKKHTYDLSYDGFYGFNSNMGIAEIKSGKMGWEWIKSIEPLTKENEIHLYGALSENP